MRTRSTLIGIAAPALAATLLALGACQNDAPTGPRTVTGPNALINNNRTGGPLTAKVTQQITYLGGTYTLTGVLTITRFDITEDRQLLATGTLAYSVPGTPAAAGEVISFERVPATLTAASAAASPAASGAAPSPSFALSTAALAAPITTQQEPPPPGGASCPILLLNLGPLTLNLLGLQVDLNQVILNVTAFAGAGMLLGNLLCAIVHLLDGPGAFAAILELLNTVNTILAGVGA
jgi:hypothetical protein